jgi:lysophospholipase L1-like esterase
MKQIEPDLVIISLGTNDTYTKNFVPSYYKQNYINFIAEIKKANPDAAILLTVPNDDYYRRRYPNRNIQEAEDVILELAKEYGYGVWNFYQIMGGFNSSSLWYKDFLMAYDRIHFTTKGYLIKGDLLFFAILKSYDNHIDNKNKKRLP